VRIPGCPLRFAVAAWVTACAPDIAVRLDPPDGTRSVLLADESDPPSLTASDLPAELERTLAELEARPIHALFFADDLAALQIPPGSVTPALAEPDRPIPPRVGQRRTVAAEGTVDWVDEPTLPDPIAEIRLRPLDPIACAFAGGCFESAAPIRCKVPCADPPPVLPPDPPRSIDGPSPPELLPCAAGWLEIPGADPPRCEPPGLFAFVACSSSQAQWFSEASCSRVGSACPTDAFPPWTGPAVYVRAGSNGTGTAGDPYGRIADALALTPGDAAILIAPGTYTEELWANRDRTLIGACPERTHLRGVLPLQATDGARVTVRDLSIRGDATAVVAVFGALLELEDVVLESASDNCALIDGAELVARRVSLPSCGLRSVLAAGARVSAEDFVAAASTFTSIELIAGSTVTLDRFVIRDVAAIGPETGSGLGVGPGSVLVARRGAIAGTPGAGVVSPYASSRINLEDLSVSDAGYGIHHLEGRLEADRIDVHDVRDRAVFIRGSATATITDLVVRRSTVQGIEGAAVRLDGGSRAVLRRAILEDGTGGVAMDRRGTTATIEDTYIARHASTATFAAYGIRLEQPSRALVRRTWIEDVAGVGILASNDAAIELEDLTIRRTVRDGAGLEGRGLYLFSAEGTASRARIDGAVQGVLVNRPGSRLVADDLEVAGTAEVGILVTAEGEVRASGVEIRENRGLAILVELESTGSFADLTSIADSVPTATAFAVTESSSVTLVRAAFHGSGDLTARASDFDATSLVVTDPISSGFRAVQGAIVRLAQVEIHFPSGWGVSSETESRVVGSNIAVTETVRGARGYGASFVARELAFLDVSQFSLSGSVEQCVLFELGEMSLASGIVEGCPIGAEIRDPSADGSSILENVIYRDTARPIVLMR
jgi:hypothetical protein